MRSLRSVGRAVILASRDDSAAGLNATKRQFSTRPSEKVNVQEGGELIRLHLPPKLAHELSKVTTGYYDSIGANQGHLKQISLQEIENWTEEFRRIVKKNEPRFLDELEEAHKLSPMITIIDGISVPQVLPSEIPNHRNESLADNQILLKKLRPAEVTMASFSRMLGVAPQTHSYNGLIGYIYATENEANNPSSFHSSATALKWHNDGWASGEAIPYLVLCGIKGHNMTPTRFIPCQRIIQYFYDSGRQDLLKSLDRVCLIEGYNDSFLETEIRIIDSQKNLTNFAHYGRFTSKPAFIDQDFDEAISFFKEALDKIPAIELSIQSGQMVKVKNQKGLHERGPNPNAISNRLVARILGEESRDKGKS